MYVNYQLCKIYKIMPNNIQHTDEQISNILKRKTLPVISYVAITSQISLYEYNHI